MKKKLYLLSVIVFLALTGQAIAYTIQLNPVTQVIGLGKTATVNIELNVGNLESLEGFTMALAFNNAILGFNSATSTTIGDSNLNYLSLLADNGDSVGLIGFLFDSTNGIPLTNGIYNLASLNFTGNSYGISPLVLTGTVLNLGDSFETGLNTDTGSVDVVPEPGTFLLFGLGLAGLVGYRKKFRKS